MSLDLSSNSYYEEKEEDSTRLSYKSFESQELENLCEDVVILDWDDTLFITSYLDNYSLDYLSIFSGKTDLEQGFTFLQNELKELEKVKI